MRTARRGRSAGPACWTAGLGYQQQLRVERAEHLIGHGATVESTAQAVEFTDARMLRRLRARAHSPTASRAGGVGVR
ncbi:hypothetical protein ABZ807_05740 [Micromonospora sp. NPDC047548]|uniref:hypothetical protein n=1 Tax=Micromonospora sp. NPDC047548 TaxID=3155624 RepID=UPI0034068B10